MLCPALAPTRPTLAVALHYYGCGSAPLTLWPAHALALPCFGSGSAPLWFWLYHALVLALPRSGASSSLLMLCLCPALALASHTFCCRGQPTLFGCCEQPALFGCRGQPALSDVDTQRSTARTARTPSAPCRPRIPCAPTGVADPPPNAERQPPTQCCLVCETRTQRVSAAQALPQPFLCPALAQALP